MIKMEIIIKETTDDGLRTCVECDVHVTGRKVEESEQKVLKEFENRLRVNEKFQKMKVKQDTTELKDKLNTLLKYLEEN